MSRSLLISLMPFFAGIFFLSFQKNDARISDLPPAKLSEYGFFKGSLSNQQPADGIIPYDLNTPLFSDYAGKLRFVKIPSGQHAMYNDSSVFDFPVGTVLIKTFYFPVDFRNAEKGRKLIETRLLVHEETGWKAWPYVWNEDQTEAFLEIAGEEKQISYTSTQGTRIKRPYFIPNVNQCKGCHNKYEKLSPIGPSSWQLNRDFSYPDAGSQNQLFYWKNNHLLEQLPVVEKIPKAPVWDDPSTGPIDARARIWLDINCAHCHNPGGPAVSSGLNLQFNEADPLKTGILKTPVAAGRGSGNLQFDIVPGKPDESILLFRIGSNDPGIMMPELGRTVRPNEGYDLVRDWIRQMN